MRYSLSFNLCGRSSKKQKFLPLTEIDEDGSALVKSSLSRMRYLPVIDVVMSTEI